MQAYAGSNPAPSTRLQLASRRIPEWTEEDFARAKRGEDILPPALLEAFKSKGGRPKGSSKELVSLRLDREVLDRFRAGGPGWQTRINEALRRAKA